MPGMKRGEWKRLRDVQHGRDIALGNIDRESRAHVEVSVRLGIVDAADRLDEIENGLRRRNALDDVGEWIRRTHQLSPAMARDVDGIVNVDALVQAIFNSTNIDM